MNAFTLIQNEFNQGFCYTLRRIVNLNKKRFFFSDIKDKTREAYNYLTPE